VLIVAPTQGWYSLWDAKNPKTPHVAIKKQLAKIETELDSDLLTLFQFIT
jgi:hypothetical protein